MKLATLEDADKALFVYVPNGGKIKKYNLERISKLAAALGDPQNKLKVVHVAGTSGKTSTAYFIRGMLQQAGKRTGLTVSPYVVSITERVQVDGLPLPEADFVNHLQAFLPLVEKIDKKLDVKPTYFEVLMIFAYWLFAKLGLDYAVIETGMGGTLDGSNIADRADKVCVITDIGYDHTEFLGGTLESIASNKAGIIHDGNHALVQHQQKQVLDIVKQAAAKHHAELQIVKDLSGAPSQLPLFQRRNWAIAAAAYDYIAARDGLSSLSPEQTRAVAAQPPPGRMEEYTIGDKKIILDGAHNGQKLESLCEALREKGIGTMATLASFTTSRSKLDDMLVTLKDTVSHLIITEFVVVQDVGKVSHTGEEIAARAKELGYASIQICKSQQEAFDALLARPEKELLITGSLYLVGQMRPLLVAATAGHATLKKHERIASR
jgi:dihydrofolate synthase / folylpolyglutamate synthase